MAHPGTLKVGRPFAQRNPPSGWRLASWLYLVSLSHMLNMLKRAAPETRNTTANSRPPTYSPIAAAMQHRRPEPGGY